MGTVNSKSEIDASHDLRNLSVGGARCQHSRFQGQTNRLQNGADSVSASSLAILVQALPFWLAAFHFSY